MTSRFCVTLVFVVVVLLVVVGVVVVVSVIVVTVVILVVDGLATYVGTTKLAGVEVEWLENEAPVVLLEVKKATFSMLGFVTRRRTARRSTPFIVVTVVAAVVEDDLIVSLFVSRRPKLFTGIAAVEAITPSASSSKKVDVT